VITNLQYLSAFVAAASICGAVTPLMKRLALKRGIVDTPNQAHKTHRDSVPYLGGLAIIVSVFVTGALGVVINADYQSSLSLALSVFLPALFLGIIGLIDDIYQLSPASRFTAQTISGFFTATFLISTSTVGSPTGFTFLDFAITIFWIVGITNSINFFDNHDGGASGAVAISSLGLFVVAAASGQYLIASLAIVLSGSCFGFLFWNRNPARIYMGDAGALFLGTMVASLLVRLEPNPINRLASFSVPILILALPILDTSVAVLSRLKRRISPFQGGRDHLSHRLMRLGFSRKRTAIALWALTGYFVILAIVVSNVQYSYEGLVTSIGLLSWMALFVFFFRLKDE
jgi:UDP-GlcNAc:undecaprenyl-phosphate/decaprenyl-phosphate GlcNAc-1-phosphate transferase